MQRKNADKRISIGKRSNDYVLLPTIAILDMDKEFGQFFIEPYRYRIAFGFWNWRISFAIGKNRIKRRTIT